MDLNDRQRDALTEVLNIATARTAAALSDLTGQRVVLDVPHVVIHPIGELTAALGSFIQGDIVTVHQIFSGPVAGDALLQLGGETLRANIRPYDVIVRYGGDELVCAMPNVSALDARTRFDKIAAALTAVNAEHSVTVGLAEADPADSLQELIARADADLLEARRSGQRNDC